MTEQHPTIPGVTVKESSEWCFSDGQCIDYPNERYRTLRGEPDLSVDAFLGDPSLIAIMGTDCTIEEAETVVAMILNQVAWLKEQEAVTA